MRQRSAEEIEHLSKLETINFIICNAGIGTRYFIIIEQSISKFAPCYLNDQCEIVAGFDSNDYIGSYDECLKIIEKRYNISHQVETPSCYQGIEASE